MTQWKVFVNVMQLMGKRCGIYLTAIFFMSTGWAAFSVLESLLVKNVVDAAQTAGAENIPFIIGGNVLGGVAALLVYRIATITYNVEAKRAYGTICKIVFHHEVRMPYTYYEEHHSGEFISKLSYDLEKVGSIYGSRFRRAVAPILQVVVYMVPMLILSWQITLCLIGVNVVMLLINALLIEPMKDVSQKLSGINGKMTEKMSNLLQGMEQARMYAAGKQTVKAFVTESERFEKESNKKIMLTAILESCSNGFDLLCALAFLMLGIYFVQGGYTTLGALAAIYTLYGSFSFQFLQLGRYVPELISCLVNARNIFAFLEEEEEPDCWYGRGEASGTTSEPQKGLADEATAITIDNIEFRYRENKPLIKDYSLGVSSGESVAITGPSGCGKTTLSKLLLGLYPVKNGDISVEGESYHKLANREVRERISYVPQEPYLFNETIRENIRLGKPDATDGEIEDAAKMAYAHDFIVNLPDGYDTKVGERGNNLSGGQRQRIAIARAILKNAPIVLLDEATSALDNESEQLVNEALKSMKNEKTIIMIAHRPSTIALADRICECRESTCKA